MFIYFWKRERAHRGGAERKGERESQAGPMLIVQTELDVGLNPGNHKIMTWGETKNQALNWLSHPGAPKRNLKTYSTN